MPKSVSNRGFFCNLDCQGSVSVKVFYAYDSVPQQGSLSKGSLGAHALTGARTIYPQAPLSPAEAASSQHPKEAVVFLAPPCLTEAGSLRSEPRLLAQRLGRVEGNVPLSPRALASPQ